MKNYIICFLSVFIFLQSFSVSAADYSRKAEFGPVRFTVEQIAKISNDLLAYIQSVNNPSEPTKGTIEFESERYSASFDLPLLTKDYDKVPDNSYTFKFRVRSLDNNITSVIISFGDSYRYADISGQNHSHVTGFLSIAQDKISDHATNIGGSKFRIFLAVACTIILLLPFFWVTWRYDSPKVLVMALVVFLVLSNAVIHLIPWYRVFPGTLITYEPLSLLQRYSHIFTFFGFLVAILAFAWPFVLKGSKKLKRTNEPRGESS